MDEKLLKALEEMKTSLAGKSKEEVETAIKAFEEKFNDAVEEKVKGLIGEEVKTVKEQMEAEAKKELDEMQKHLDAMDVKLKARKAGEKAGENQFNALLKANFENIKEVDKTKGFKLEVKDMTLGNALTGDQPRVHNNDVVRRHPQIVNVSDLAQSISIAGGTYTYTRSTLASGTVGAQTEGAAKNQLEYDYTMVDANTDFIAGFAVYSKKMRNNLPFLESTLSMDLRDDYNRGENTIFEAILAAQATASTQVITGSNKIEMLIAELGVLAAGNTMATAMVVTAADYYDILVTEKSTGAGYGLPGVVSQEGGNLRINGIPLVIATWLPTNKYYVGNWSRVRKVVTEGFSLAFSEEDSDNFRKNNITARVESQTTLTVERPSDLILGDFTAV